MYEYYLLIGSALGALAFILYLLRANQEYAKSNDAYRATINGATASQIETREELFVERAAILNTICVDPTLTYIACDTRILKYKSGEKVFSMWLDTQVLTECKKLVLGFKC